MDFGLTDEQRMFRKTFADFSDEVVAPGAAESDENEEFDESIWNQMGELGLTGLIVPEERGTALEPGLCYGCRRNFCNPMG